MPSEVLPDNDYDADLVPDEDPSIMDRNDNYSDDHTDETNGDDNQHRPILSRTTSIERELADAIVRIAPIDELSELLDMGAAVNARLRHGLSLLHYAVWQNYVEAAVLLIEAGAEINAQDNIGYSPLHIAAEHGFIESMDLLLKYNAKVNFNIPDPHDEDYPLNMLDEPLRLALKHNHYEAAKLLLKNGANPNTKYFFGSEINLVNPLKSDLLNLLLSYGVDPNTRDRHGFTPLMKICRLQQGMESCLLLISYGADPNMRTDQRHDFRSVLHYAVLSGSTAIANLMIKQGADVRFEREYNRSTPLHLAILKGDVPMVKLLLEAGSDPNAISTIIGSPLHMACSEGVQNRHEIMEILLKNGANPNLVIFGDDGSPIKPPIAEYLSIDKPEISIVRLLLRHGAEVIMQSQNKEPNGVLNCLPNLSKYPNVLHAVLSAAQKFDIPLILNSSLIDKDQREAYIEAGQSPLSLKHTLRLSIRDTMGKNILSHIDKLEIPKFLQRYLLYEIS